jgi:cation:H+ antiporter
VQILSLLTFAAGLLSLTLGGEALVRGASRLAAVLGVSPLVIGLTVVAFGTSSPELAVSVGSALSGQPDIAVGNVVGSNILNVLFILGLSALLAPLLVAQQLVWLDVPVMIAVSALTIVLGWDGQVSRLDGALLFAGLLLYTGWLVRLSRRQNPSGAVAESVAQVPPARHGGARRLLGQIGLVLVGLALLVLGARWLVASAVEIARSLRMSELVIGLTIVAAGTSLPEVATSVMASLRGERDIAVGNVVGSNIFNILAVLGLTALVAPHGVPVAPAALHFDIPVMIAVALACLPVFFTGHLIARWEGLLFVAYYVAYTAYLLLDASGHDALPAYSAVMLKFVIPLTAVTLALLTVRALRNPRPAGG